MSIRLRWLFTVLLAAALAAMPGAAAAERCPCGDLLLPYFELGVPESPGAATFDLRTVTFATGNRTSEARMVELRVWTNWGIPVLTTSKLLEPKSMFTVNLRDWLIFGRLPDRQLTDAELAVLQARLAGLPSPDDGLYYASAVAPGTAVGYLTAGVMTPGGAAQTLWGDTFAIDPVEEDAAGLSLVRLVDDDSRELCDHHLLRFLEGGAFEAHTRFVLWNGVQGAASATPQPNFARPTIRCDLYDEAGAFLGQRSLPLIATQAILVQDLNLPAPFGWAECETGGLSFMCQDHSAGARFDVALRTFCVRSREQGDHPGRAAISLEKRSNGEDADLPTGPRIPVGDPVQWEYVITNTGAVSLFDIELSDAPPVQIDCPGATLAMGESMTCAAFGEAQLGQFHNVATVTAHATGGQEVSASDPSHYYGSVPGIGIEKLTNGEDADLPPGPQLVPGAAVMWTYVVTNTGNAPLENVSVSDSRGVAVTCPATTLDVGESMLCTAAGTAAAGQYSNVGTASGVTDLGEAVEAADPSHYFGLDPGISLQKFTNGADADVPPGPTVPLGAAVTWTYVVTNTGNVPLTDVTVTDNRGVLVSCPKSTLAVGESMTCTASGVAECPPSASMSAAAKCVEGCQYDNLGLATGMDPGGRGVEATDPSHYWAEPEIQLGDEGCTPGYWKNHTGSWTATGLSPGQTVASLFANAAGYPGLGDATLLAALDFGGGPGVDGAARILLRAAVAAALNAAHSSVAYPRSLGAVISDVDAALAGGDRDAMLLLAAALDADNNLGCPLS